MKKSNRIIVPTDFSETAQNAFRYAVSVAQQMELPVHVIHVIQPEVEPLDFPVLASEAMQAKSEMAESAMEEFMALNTNPDIQVTQEIEYGLPGDLVPELADNKSQPSMIVMGTQQEHDTFDRLLGSVSSAILRKAKSPVWIVPSEAKFEPIRSVMYASQMRDSDPKNILELAGLLHKTKPYLHCVHIDRDKRTDVEIEEMKTLFENYVADIDIRFHEIDDDDDEMVEILDEKAEELDADLLVMVRSHRNFFERLFQPSLTRKMLFHTKIPMLVLR